LATLRLCRPGLPCLTVTSLAIYGYSLGCRSLSGSLGYLSGVIVPPAALASGGLAAIFLAFQACCHVTLFALCNVTLTQGVYLRCRQKPQQPPADMDDVGVARLRPLQSAGRAPGLPLRRGRRRGLASSRMRGALASCIRRTPTAAIAGAAAVLTYRKREPA
jgi:hypothetical protein